MSRSLLTNETSELDLLDQRPFDQTDFDILKSYEAVVDGLAMLIGSHCEIVLHSLQDLKCSAIRIANGEHTGRQIGSPITDLALRMLHDMTGAYEVPEPMMKKIRSIFGTGWADENRIELSMV